MIVVFEGAEARQHKIEANQGVESLAGVARVGALVAHYVSTGHVRFRRPFADNIQFYLTGTQPGSLGAVFQIVATNAGNAAQLVNKTGKLLQHVVARATGQAPVGPLIIDGQPVPEGDIDALAEAAEHGLKRAHTWIDIQGKSITLEGDQNQRIILNDRTKEFMEEEVIAADEDIQDVSVGALNVNSKSGRVYFNDLGRTVQFKVAGNARGRTVPNLAQYLGEYAERTGATVNIRFTRVFFPDMRLKRIIIHDCFPIGGLA